MPTKKSGPRIGLAALLLVAIVLMATCGGGGGGGSNPPPPPQPTITSVTVSPTSATLEVGVTQQFTATVQGTGSFNSAVTWQDWKKRKSIYFAVDMRHVRFLQWRNENNRGRVRSAWQHRKDPTSERAS